MLHQGAVVEVGTHDELMKHRGRYYALYRQQRVSDVNESQNLVPSSSGVLTIWSRAHAVGCIASTMATCKSTDLNSFDDSILQQGRFWIFVTWTLIGTTFSVWHGWRRVPKKL